MSVITALTIHQAMQRQASAQADPAEDENVPSAVFSPEERSSFVEHMSRGVREMVLPVEDMIMSRTREILQNQVLLEQVVETEEARFAASNADLEAAQQIILKIPIYKQRLSLIKREMASINKRCSKLSSKAEQLRGVRERLQDRENQAAAKFAKLEARVVSTTPRPPSKS